jgi:hypothetical protein
VVDETADDISEESHVDRVEGRAVEHALAGGGGTNRSRDWLQCSANGWRLMAEQVVHDDDVAG